MDDDLGANGPVTDDIDEMEELRVSADPDA